MSESTAYRDQFLESAHRVRQEHKDYVEQRPRSKAPVPGGLDSMAVGQMVHKHFGSEIDAGDHIRLDAWIKTQQPGANVDSERAKLIKLRDAYKAMGE